MVKRNPGPKDITGASDEPKPTVAQLKYLRLGEQQPGRKLPLFDGHGQSINPKTIQSCIQQGWAEPWFSNPAKPDWLVCRLTEKGLQLLQRN